MYFFLTQMIDWNVSGIEHAEAKRLKIFRDHHIPAKILTRDYNRYLHLYLKRLGVTNDESINLFDFFQGTLNYSGPVKKIESFINDNYSVRHDGNQYVFNADGERQFSVAVFTDMENYEEDQVESTKTYDRFGHLVKKDNYDVRGFLSSTEVMDQNGEMTQLLIYDIDQNVKIVGDYDASGSVIWRLNAYKDQNYVFANIDELNAFFYDQVNGQYTGTNTFIGDREYIVDAGLLNMQTSARRFEYWHNIHVDDPAKPISSHLNSTLISELNASEKINGIITPSARQRDDMKKRFSSIPVYTIPPVFVDVAPNVEFDNRIKGRILCVARIHEQKHLEHMLLAFKRVHDQLPYASLRVYGYVNDDKLKDKLLGMVKDMNLTQEVQFADYVPDLSRVYSESQVVAASSRYEGFNMSLVEGLSHGVPLAAYDYNYGADDIIENGVNGFLAEQDNIEELADKIVALIGDQRQLRVYSENAYKTANNFSEEKIWNLWNQWVVSNFSNDKRVLKN